MKDIIFTVLFSTLSAFGTSGNQEKNVSEKYRISDPVDFLNIYSFLKDRGDLTYSVAGNYDPKEFKTEVCDVIGHDWKNKEEAVDIEVAKSTGTVDYAKTHDGARGTVGDVLTNECLKCGTREITNYSINIVAIRRYEQ